MQCVTVCTTTTISILTQHGCGMLCKVPRPLGGAPLILLDESKYSKKVPFFLQNQQAFALSNSIRFFGRKYFSQLGTCHTLWLRCNCIIWANTYTQIFFSLMITFVNSYQYDLVFSIYSDIFISAIFSRHFKNV